MEEAPVTTNPPDGSPSHLDYCARGFRSTHNARVDLARLGALCGPSNGLTRLWTTTAAIGERESDDGVATDVPWRRAPPASGCGRFVFAFSADPPKRALVAHWVGGDRHLAECRLSESGFCPSNELVCDATALEVRVADAKLVTEGISTLPRTDSGVIKVNVAWWALANGAPRSPSVVAKSSAEALLPAE